METITLIASHTIDHVYDERTATHYDIPGGPALFCKKALDSMGVNVNLISSKNSADISLTFNDREESIRVDSIEEIEIDPGKPTGNILISPILQEINLENIPPHNSKIFLDVQGYVRQKGTAEMRLWQYAPDKLRNVAALKANSREIAYITPEIISFFKQRILLLTKGGNGFELWHHGKKTEIHGNNINMSPVDTIGAGDFFFATFTACYLKNNNTQEAAKIAQLRTEDFLRNKKSFTSQP